MGAAAAIESRKPVDASDIVASGSVEFAKQEIINLRSSLGKYATQAGFNQELIMDASDLVKGDDEEEDFNRCVAEIRHIRNCLRLSTQGARRQTRGAVTGSFTYESEKKTADDYDVKEGDDDDDDDDDRSDDSNEPPPNNQQSEGKSSYK